MGYTTEFEGCFNLNKKLDDGLKTYLIKFNETRRMKRNLSPEYGIDGEFFVNGTGFAGQDNDSSVVDHNRPPSTQPGLWCQWRPSDDGMSIEWDGGEKFYEYEDWLIYIICNFLVPNGYILNGEVSFQGEDSEDAGTLIVKDNVLYLSKTERKQTKPRLYVSGFYSDQVKFVLDNVFETKILIGEGNG